MGFALSSKPTVPKGSIMSGLCFYILPSKQLYFTDINGLSSGGITQSIILLCFLNSLNRKFQPNFSLTPYKQYF